MWLLHILQTKKLNVFFSELIISICDTSTPRTNSNEKMLNIMASDYLERIFGLSFMNECLNYKAKNDSWASWIDSLTSSNLYFDTTLQAFNFSSRQLMKRIFEHKSVNLVYLKTLLLSWTNKPSNSLQSIADFEGKIDNFDLKLTINEDDMKSMSLTKNVYNSGKLELISLNIADDRIFYH